MPRVELKNKTGTTDVTNMISEIRWSGSISEIARVLEIQFLYPLHDYYTPKIYPNIGDTMYLYDDTGEELFRGKVFYNERLSEQGTIQITCYDDAIRLSKSKGTYNFKNKTAEAITRTVCNDLGISIGKLASTGIPQKMLCSSMGMYEIIMSAYESASKQNKKKYHIAMKQGKLYVEEVGKKVLDYTLKADSNILESTYSENAEGVVNKVNIYDEEDQYLGVVQNDELINLVGVFQEIYIKEEDKQAKTMASSMLQGITKEATVTVKGNINCLSGKTIRVEDSLTKLMGSFYIEADEHEWINRQYRTIMVIK